MELECKKADVVAVATNNVQDHPVFPPRLAARDWLNLVDQHEADQKRIAELEKEYVSLTNEVSYAHKKLNEANSENQRHRARIAELEKRNAELETRVQETDRGWDEKCQWLRSHHRARIADLEKRNSELEEVARTAADELRSFETHPAGEANIKPLALFWLKEIAHRLYPTKPKPKPEPPASASLCPTCAELERQLSEANAKLAQRAAVCAKQAQYLRKWAAKAGHEEALCYNIMAGQIEPMDSDTPPAYDPDDVAFKCRKCEEMQARDKLIANQLRGIGRETAASGMINVPRECREISDRLDPPEPKPEPQSDPHPWLTALRKMKDEAIVAANYERAAALRDAIKVVEPTEPEPEPKRCRIVFVGQVYHHDVWLKWMLVAADTTSSSDDAEIASGLSKGVADARRDAEAVARARGLEVVE